MVMISKLDLQLSRECRRSLLFTCLYIINVKGIYMISDTMLTDVILVVLTLYKYRKNWLKTKRIY